MARILAIDYGTKRTGIALSDPLRIIAGSAQTIPTAILTATLDNYLTRGDVDTVVMGMPRRMDGRPSESFAQISPFFEKLRVKYPGIKIEYHDERFTSVMAHRAIIEGGVKKMARRNKGLVDTVSAAIILQSYIDSNK